MRIISNVLTIAAVIALIYCFRDESALLVALPLVILASWSDKAAIEHEMREFRSRGSKP